MRPQPRTQSPQHRRQSGRGFTLIELLIVMTILVILIGLLLPAIRGASINVRNAAVQAEINRIATAIVSFKTKYGVEPPSTIRMPETGGANGANWDARSKSLIRQLWPQFDFSANNDINGDNDTTDVIQLNPAESLVFFLGGMPDPAAAPNFGLLGFSRNPQRPFARDTTTTKVNRDKSAYDFEPGRLVDTDSNIPTEDKMPEFLDSYPGQTTPLVYFSSYDGAGYRAADYPGNQSPGNKTIPLEAYRQGKTITSPYFNKNGFQIISPGLDHQFGPGGPYEAGADIALPPYTQPTGLMLAVSTDDRKTESDNITNFGNGKLVP